MDVVYSYEFKKELKKRGGNIIIAGITLDTSNDTSPNETGISLDSLNLVPILGSHNKNNNTLEIYFELPEDYFDSEIYTLHFFWNRGSKDVNKGDKLDCAFVVYESGKELELSKHRNLVSIELPSETEADVVFNLPDSDFKFLERSDPFVQENLIRETLDNEKSISPGSFYKKVYTTKTLDNRKPVELYGRDNRAIVYKQYKELNLTCESTVEDFGRTVRYGLYQDVQPGSYNSQYFQGSAVYDEYTYLCGKLIGVRENISTPINTVEGIHLVTKLIDISGGTSDPKNATEFIADDSRFCVDYSRMYDLALCTCDVYAEVYVYDRNLEDSLKVIKSNTIRITQQPEDISLMIIPNPRDEEKYYKTTERDVKRFDIASGTPVVIVNPEEKEDLVLIHSVDPISSDSIYLDYGESIEDAFDITIKRIDIKKQNIELGIKIRSVEGYVTRKAATWYPLRKLMESAEPWLYTVKVNSGGHVFEFCPVIKNTYFSEADISINNDTEDTSKKILKISFVPGGNKRCYFGLTSTKSLTVTYLDGDVEKTVKNGRLLTNMEYTVSGLDNVDNLSIYQSDSYIDNYSENTDWRKEVGTYLYTIKKVIEENTEESEETPTEETNT